MKDSTGNGKGGEYRKVDRKKWEVNYAKIFKKKRVRRSKKK